MEKSTMSLKGKHVHLRDFRLSDLDRYIEWQTTGEWLHYDAPWEVSGKKMTPERESKIREYFSALRQEDLPMPRKTCIIALLEDDHPIGWVNRYGNKRFPEVAYIGIDICEDDCLNRGLGTETLRLWVDYLFESSTLHKIECHTWSFNPRMMRVAEKIGFIHEGIERQIIQWQGEWQDRVRYGMLRSEWERS